MSGEKPESPKLHLIEHKGAYVWNKTETEDFPGFRCREDDVWVCSYPRSDVRQSICGQLWEQGATCVTADYLMGDNGRVTVLNSERLGAGTGSLKVIHGYAEPDGEPGKFSVHLEGVPVGANYWVLKLGPATFGSKGQYQYAVVSDSIRGTLFVLARDPDVFKRDYENEVTTFLDNNGSMSFYNNRVVTYHGKDCVYNKDHQ